MGRRSIRLAEFNYGQSGAYFITFCTHNRACILSTIVDGLIMLSEIGKIAEHEIRRTEQIREFAKIPEFVIMPNHIHLIIQIENDLSLETQSGILFRQSASVPSIVSGIKAAITRKSFQEGIIHTKDLWQRNYYEHVIRDDDDYLRISQYIENNPMTWDQDRENPVGAHGNAPKLISTSVGTRDNESDEEEGALPCAPTDGNNNLGILPYPPTI